MKCKNCGAELNNGKCEYCGTVWIKNEPPLSFAILTDNGITHLDREETMDFTHGSIIFHRKEFKGKPIALIAQLGIKQYQGEIEKIVYKNDTMEIIPKIKVEYTPYEVIHV